MDELNILVIDDESIVTRTMKNILELEGHEVEGAYTGQDGLEKLKAGRYNFVFLDLKLPDMNGVDVLNELRKFNSEISVIVITGYGTIESAISVIRRGASDYILKPVDPTQIRNAINRTLKRREIESRIRAGIPAKKVLLVENDTGVFNELKQKLESNNVETVLTGDLEEALGVLSSDKAVNNVFYENTGNYEQDMDFLEKALGRNPEMLFIFVTSSPDLKTAIDAMKKGAYDYLMRPLHPSSIIETLNKAWKAKDLTFVNKQLVFEFQKINQEISRNERRFSAILKNIADAVVTVDTKNNVSLLNDTAEKLLGTSRDDAVGSPVEDVLRLKDEAGMEDEEAVLHHILQSRMESVPFDDIILHSYDGRLIPVTVTVNTITHSDGEKIGRVLVFRDITRRKKMEQKLIEKNRALEDFAHKVSHHLKNPLNNICGFMKAIKENPSLFDAHFDRVVGITEPLIKFINNLLKLSRAGKAIGKKESLDLKSLMKKVAYISNSEKIPLKIDIDPDIPPLIGDPDTMEQVFSNLLQNSLRHRDPQKEKLRISVSHSRENGFSVYSIKDNGMGIEREDIGKIFELGYSLKEAKDGSGFGLTIAKKIIEAHGGAIEVKSEGTRKGAEFILHIPAKG